MTNSLRRTNWNCKPPTMFSKVLGDSELSPLHFSYLAIVSCQTTRKGFHGSVVGLLYRFIPKFLQYQKHKAKLTDVCLFDG